MNIPIKDSIDKVPGGLMVIPLLLGAIINTIAPAALNIGSFTTQISHHGALPMIGVFLVCMGSGINLKAAPVAVKKGVVVTLIKFIIGAVIGIAVVKIFGSEGFLGLSGLAIISAMTNSNGGLYAALTGEFGNETDVGAIAIVSINDGPFLTMIALGAAGIANFSALTLLGTVLPIIVGMILGNLDPKMKNFLMSGGSVLTFFFAFGLGCGINFTMLLHAGIPGIILGLMTIIIGGFFTILGDKITGGSGIAGASVASTSGNAVATPAAVALLDPNLKHIADTATGQVAASTILSVLLVPVLVSLVKKHNLKREANKAKKA